MGNSGLKLQWQNYVIVICVSDNKRGHFLKVRIANYVLFTKVILAGEGDTSNYVGNVCSWWMVVEIWQGYREHAEI